MNTEHNIAIIVPRNMPQRTQSFKYGKKMCNKKANNSASNALNKSKSLIIFLLLSCYCNGGLKNIVQHFHGNFDYMALLLW